MQEPGSRVPVRPALPISEGNSTLPATTVAASGHPELQRPSADSDSTHVKTNIAPEQGEQGEQGESSWWSPGMPMFSAMGYDPAWEGTYTFDQYPFYQQ